jgi:hypothetical protein
VSGLQETGLLICMRMLASGFKEDEEFTLSFTLPVPSEEGFKAYSRLGWFPIVCAGLGIRVRYLKDRPLLYNDMSLIEIEWHQKYQKKKFDIEKGKGNVDVDVRKKMEETFGPDVDEREVKRESLTYLRRRCGGRGLGGTRYGIR